jgi:thioester reductase-like protein
MAATTDLRPYVTLPEDLGDPAPGATGDRPGRILLTGATGYLGAFLLAELLARSDAHVVCLVRDPEAGDGRARILENLARYDLHTDVSRITALPGVVEEPRLGLDRPTWDRLACDVDAIVHAAANVSFLHALDRLWPVNVGGALALLRLAGHARLKPLHLVSSYSVFNDAAYTGIRCVAEEPLAGQGKGFRRGYPASKWIAERVTDLARDRGWNVTTHRLGLLWGDARTGRGKADDVLTLNLRACLALGLAQDIDFLMHVTPVDFAAAAVAAVALSPELANHHYHVITETPIAWRDLVAWLRGQGHALDLVPAADWYAALSGALAGHREWMPLAFLVGQDPRRSFWNDANIFSMQFDASRLRSALAGTGIVCPPLDTPLLRTYTDAVTRAVVRSTST